MSETVKVGSSAMARRTISRRCGAGASDTDGLCGGSPVGMKMIRWSWSRSRTCAAMMRWQRWMGLKVPPNSPSFILTNAERARSLCIVPRSSLQNDQVVPVNHLFILLKPHHLLGVRCLEPFDLPKRLRRDIDQPFG